MQKVSNSTPDENVLHTEYSLSLVLHAHLPHSTALDHILDDYPHASSCGQWHCGEEADVAW